MDIKEVDGSKPVCLRPYKTTASEREAIREIVREWKDNGIVTETRSPYASPVLLVRKKTGDHRLVVDYRRLNIQTVKDKFPLPRIDDLLEGLRNAKFFTTLDLAHGYLQIPLTDKAKLKTAFITPDDTGQFERMIFGLANAPAEFQRLMHTVLGPLLNKKAFCYLDDVIIPAKDWREMIERLREVLERIRSAKLTLKPSKCEFGRREVEFLGYVISTGGLKPGPRKIKAIEEFPEPKNVHDIRRFLGLTNFFRRFVKDFARKAEPLSRLTKKGSQFEWKEEQRRSFGGLRKDLVEYPVLAHYNPELKTEVHCDASAEGLAGMVLQMDEDCKWRLVYCVSKKTTEAEKMYHSSKLELMAIVWTLDRLRQFLVGIKFTVVTDCQALVYMNAKKTTNPQIARWYNLIQEYDFEIRHKPGEKMAHVDGMSRAPVDDPRDTMEEIAEKNLEVCLTITLEEQILMIQHSDPELRDLIQIFRKDPCDRTVGEQNRINDSATEESPDEEPEVEDTPRRNPRRSCNARFNRGRLKSRNGRMETNEKLNIVRMIQQLSSNPFNPKREFRKLFNGLGHAKINYKISLQPDAKPYALCTPRRVPIPLMKQLKEQLEEMTRLGVIESVEEPTEWCAGMVTVPKPGGKLRICVDLTKLNQYIRRKNYPLPATEHILGQLGNACYFSKLDANSGFWQFGLAKESQKLTTFITPFGRFLFKRILFGISSAPEIFQRKMTQLLGKIEGVVCFMDDIVVYGSSLEEHNERDITHRLQRLKMRMMRYSYQISHIAGKKQIVADVLSRKPISKRHKDELEEELSAYIQSIEFPATEERLLEISRKQKEDSLCSQVANYCTGGWPKNKKEVDPEIRGYWQFQDDLTYQNGLLLRGQRILIPRSMRKEILEKLHQGHFGINKCRSRAKESVWWLGISQEIERMVSSYTKCLKERRPKHEALMPSEFPIRPWQKVGMDLFYLNGRWYLIVCDYYSRHGMPETVRSDNGPQFQKVLGSEFSRFSKEWSFKHITSSPRFPQSNGFIEAIIKNMKQSLKKEEDCYLTLQAYRTMPLESGYSPAELLIGRRLRTSVPAIESSLMPKYLDSKALQEREKRRMINQKRLYDKRHDVHSLPQLQQGDSVWIRDQRVEGKVLHKSQKPRSYWVQTPQGK
ncbi:hypothetical protein LAZ67_4002327, partial [Cordylochernes scorpioides]